MYNEPSPAFTFAVATDADKKEIFALRHQVYAEELHQHAINGSKTLSDKLDSANHYIVAKNAKRIVGFISITPPGSEAYSVDKYFERSAIPLDFDEYLYEIRLLTVVEMNRNSILALALMYAAFRWVQSRQGKYIIAICRADILGMYSKAGLESLGRTAVSGQVSYELCMATVAQLDRKVKKNKSLFEQMQLKIHWCLPYAFFAPSSCYHGGSFYEAIGEDLQRPENAQHVINADVLDAWFPPSPKVIQSLQQHLPWLLQTSPPTMAEGLIRAIAEKRGVKPYCILPGAGSSDLIFLAFTNLLNHKSKALIIDPCYGEYIHVLEKVVQCNVTRFALHRENGFVIDTLLLQQELRKGYDCVVLVNPNSPTGQFVSKKDMHDLLLHIPANTLVWIDETYIEYAGENETLETLACRMENVIICKSMSKVYALSGVRAAYLCCSPHWIESLKPLTPPWAISLPAQAAAIIAIADDAYYKEKYNETKYLRNTLKEMLHDIGILEVIEGVANFLLFYLPEQYPLAAFLQHCREKKLYLRDVTNMGRSLGYNAIRIAVKDEKTNRKMIQIMQFAMERIVVSHTTLA